MPEKKISDATMAETVVRKQLEVKYAKNLKDLFFRKSWYTVAGSQEYYEVEGTSTLKKGLMGSEIRGFRYQVDPFNGTIMGYEEMIQAPTRP